jgi:CheY-like chemotaxis protein
MSAQEKVSQVARHSVVVLSDGSFAVRRDDDSLQDLLTGAKRKLVQDGISQPASEFELEQLKLADVIEAYDDSVVWLQHLPEAGQADAGAELKLEQGQHLFPELLISSQVDAAALKGKLGIIACREESERQAIMGVLDALQMSVTSVSTAQETFNLIEEEAFDLLVMDVRLEDMHGWAMIGRLREIANMSGIKIIVLAEPEVDEQVFALNVAKVDVYLLKPLSLPLLRQHVWVLLKGKDADAAPV